MFYYACNLILNNLKRIVQYNKLFITRKKKDSDTKYMCCQASPAKEQHFILAQEKKEHSKEQTTV